MIPTLEELGIGLVPSSPLGRGFLAGKIDENARFDSSDFRSSLPRFTPEALAANQALIRLLGGIAERKKATPAQIALAWLLAQRSPGLFRSRAPRNCLAWRKTSERPPSNSRQRICAILRRPPPGSRCKARGIPKSWSK